MSPTYPCSRSDKPSSFQPAASEHQPRHPGPWPRPEHWTAHGQHFTDHALPASSSLLLLPPSTQTLARCHLPQRRCINPAPSSGDKAFVTLCSNLPPHLFLCQRIYPPSKLVLILQGPAQMVLLQEALQAVALLPTLGSPSLCPSPDGAGRRTLPDWETTPLCSCVTRHREGGH